MSSTNKHAYDDEPAATQRKLVEAHPLHGKPLLGPDGGPWFLEEEEIEVAPKGPFGRSASNPILVNTIKGEINYMERLRTDSGAVFLYHRLGSMAARSMRTNRPGDLYELVSSDGLQWEYLYLSPYHFCRSSQVPEGLRLVPWSSMPEVERQLAYLPKRGVNGKVSNFPADLPALVKKYYQGEMESFGQLFANTLRHILATRPDWRRPPNFDNPETA